MKFCFGSVSWDGYLEKYVDIFANNYITIYRKLISLGVNFADIANPKICYNNETPEIAVKAAKTKIERVTGKELQVICNKSKLSTNTVMYSMRNRLRSEFKKTYPKENKVFFYFPIDDNIRPNLVLELINLSRKKEPTACMFKFFVAEGAKTFNAGTRPICSYKDIHPGDWGGYCAYNILNENKCPLYPKIAIPNVAFYAELYRAGYKEYESKEVCVDHLRHSDSHHFKTKDTEMSKLVRNYLMNMRKELYEKGYK